MGKFNDFLERYKFGILAALGAYVAIFVYLNIETVTQYYPIKFDLEGSRVEIPDEEVQLKPENILVPPVSGGEVKNLSRDINDTRKKSMDDYSENRPSYSNEDVEQSVKDYEKQLFEESGGYKKREEIKEEMNNRKKDNSTSTAIKQKEPSNSSGGDKQYAGNVMVDWSLSGRSAHQNNNWYVRNPGYTCGYGSAGRVMIRIQVNQNGNVLTATYDSASSSGANACMIEQAKKYAKLSRFNYASSASSTQEGYILYTFVAQ